jgi:MHS family alpha-ketoglutarate permease-like MFS transporter
MIAFGVCGIILTVPVFTALESVQSPFAAFGLVMLSLLGVSFYTSISGLVKAELFPMHVRALGVGLSYAIANAIFGGSAEYVALWFKSAGHESAFFWYVTIMSVVALVAAIAMPDSRKKSHMSADESRYIED